MASDASRVHHAGAHWQRAISHQGAVVDKTVRVDEAEAIRGTRLSPLWIAGRGVLGQPGPGRGQGRLTRSYAGRNRVKAEPPRMSTDC